MALDPKLIIGGAIVAAFLFGGKKKATSTSSAPASSDKTDEKKGDAGEPVGPDGCKTGLIEKDGICINPLDPKNNGGNTNGDSGNKPAASELIISKDCKSFQFGDKTGDSWWKNKGEKIAKQWVKSGELDPLIIAFKMISKTGSCFKDFPLEENSNHWFNLQVDRFEWINNNRQMWNLLWSVRNRIDITQFNGTETVTADPSKPNLGLVFGKDGKNFNLDKFFEMLKPMARMLIQVTSQSSKNDIGPVATTLGIKDVTYNDYNNSLVNIPTYLFTMIFPNISVNEMMAIQKKGILYKLELWTELQNYVNEYSDEPLDLEGEGF
jgi:hypothetical protein